MHSGPRNHLSFSSQCDLTTRSPSPARARSSCQVERLIDDRERLVELDTRIENQWKKTVLTGKGTVQVLVPPTRDVVPVACPKVALVVGAAGGIGREICRQLTRDGHAVVASYRSHEARALELVAEVEATGGQILAVRADVTDEASVQGLVAAAIGSLIHAVSPPIHATSFADLLWGDIAEHLDAEVKGAFLLAKACAPIMKAQGYGRIVTITSQVLDASPTPKWTAYAVGKAGLATLTRCLAVELGPLGITVNCVSLTFA